MRCPTCGRTVIISDRSYSCDCAVIPKEILEKKITPEIAHDLLTNRRTLVLDGFISKRNQKKFSAALMITGGEVKFDFKANRSGNRKEPGKDQNTFG